MEWQDRPLPAHPAYFPKNANGQETPWLLAVCAVRPERFELPTFGSVDRRSIQLSYGRVDTNFLLLPTSYGR